MWKINLIAHKSTGLMSKHNFWTFLNRQKVKPQHCESFKVASKRFDCLNPRIYLTLQTLIYIF